MKPTPAGILAILAGVALALAFPQPGWAGLAWVGPGVLLLAGAGGGGVATFRVGYVGGLAFRWVGLAWLVYIPFPVGAVAGWLALGGYLALYQGAWVWICWRCARGRRGEPPRTWLEGVDQLLARPAWWRWLWTLVCAAAWVGLEMVQARLFSGFPWDLAGVTQYRLVPLIQVASVGGVYAVSFVVVWVSVALALALVRVARQPRARWGWLGELRLPLLTLLVLCGVGFYRVQPARPADREVLLALVQPSIPQELIWDSREDSNRFAQVLRLSELALTTRPDLLVWPESSLPTLTEENYGALTNLLGRFGVPLVLGADDAEPRRAASGELEHDYFNSAFLLRADGRVAATYRKQRLVIFGEYVPLSRYLPFLRYLTPITGGFTPGTKPSAFVLGQPACVFSVLICFEDTFPGLARRHAVNGVDFLLNLTNNGWFGQSSAQWQHAAIAVFRAVENGLPLVRCTNNGLTCWVDEYGRLRQWLGSDNGNIYAPGFMTVRLPLAAPGGRLTTFYHEHGDVFGWSCAAIALTGLASVMPPRRRVVPPTGCDQRRVSGGENGPRHHTE